MSTLGLRVLPVAHRFALAGAASRENACDLGVRKGAPDKQLHLVNATVQEEPTGIGGSRRVIGTPTMAELERGS